jgi:glutathione reductase (NADPH)
LSGIYEKNLGNGKLEYIHGRKNFLNRNDIDIVSEDGSKKIINAKKILIVADIPNSRGTSPLELGITSDGFFELERQPK